MDVWIPMGGLQVLICQELGYADVGELKDAMGGTFVEFVGSLCGRRPAHPTTTTHTHTPPPLPPPTR